MTLPPLCEAECVPVGQFERSIVAEESFLRSTAFLICRNTLEVEDLVQEALCKALINRRRFRAGPNLGDGPAALCAIIFVTIATAGSVNAQPTGDVRITCAERFVAIWLYLRFPLSLRLGEVRLRLCRPLAAEGADPKDVWHLDEVVVTIVWRKQWLWRAVDQDGYVLDEIVQTRRNTKAGRRLLIQIRLKKQGCLPNASSRTSLLPTARHGVRSCPRSSTDRTRG